MYSKHKKGKSIIDERFIRTLNNNFYEYMTSIPTNAMCILTNQMIQLINTIIYIIAQLK